MNKGIIALLSIFSLVFFSACSKQDTSQKSSNDLSSSQKKYSLSKSSSVKSTVTDKKSISKKMNLDQIENGNYTRLLGDWKLDAAEERGRDVTSSRSSELKVTKKNITNDLITLNKSGIRSSDGLQDVKYDYFKTMHGVHLVAQTDGQDAVKIWTAEFYPIGTTSGYVSEGEETNSKDTIVIWTAHDSVTEVYVKNSKNNY